MKKLLQRYIAEAGLLLVGLFWGLGFVFVKIGLNEGMAPFYLTSMRFLGSFLLLYLIFFRKAGKVSRDDIKAGIVLGIIQYFGYLMQTYGAMYTTAGKNAFFTAINVVIVPYIYWILNKKKPDIFSFAASLICLMGVGVMSIDRNMNMTNLNIGDILTIGAAVFFAAQIAFTGYFGKRVDPMNLILIQMGIGGVMFAVTQFALSGIREIVPLGGMSLIAIIYLIVFSTAVPILLQTYCQRATTATRASILLSTESMFAPLFAFFILGEVLSLRVIIGAGLILFAVIVSETKLGFIKEEE